MFYRLNHIALSWNYEATVAKADLSDEQRARLEAMISVLYAAGVEHLDRLFGDIVAAIEERGLADRTVIVFTADHGEVGVRPGLPFRWTHGMQLAPDVLNVPAMFFAPGQGVEPGVYENVSRSIDILPTLLSVAGIQAPDLPGADLSAALRNEAAAPMLSAFSHTSLLPAVFYQDIDQYPLLRDLFPEWTTDYLQVGLRRQDEFFQLSPGPGGESLEPGLYDLVKDKGKQRNLFDPEDPRHQAAARELALYRARLVDAYGPGIRDLRLPKREEESRLRALGYIE
jgi:arylsulfatase A-like enzyme